MSKQRYHYLKRFDGGLNQASPVHLLGDNELQSATNVVFDELGAIRVRKGIEKDTLSLPNCRAAYYWERYDKFVTVDGNGIYVDGQFKGSYGSGRAFFVEYGPGGGTASLYISTENGGAILDSAGNLSDWTAWQSSAVIALFGGRMIFAQDSGDIKVSDSSDFSGTYSSMEIGDGKKVTGLIELGDKLLIFKKESIYQVSGDTPADWVVSRTSSAVGCAQSRTVVHCDNGVLFLSSDGLYHFNGKHAENVTLKIQGAIDSIYTGGELECCGAYHQRKYYLGYKTAPGNNDKLLVGDFSRGYRNVLWTIFQFDAYGGGTLSITDSLFSSGEELYLGGSDGLYATASASYDYDGTNNIDISFEFQTKTITSADQLALKHFRLIRFELDSADQDLTAQIFVDGLLKATTTLHTATRQTLRKNLPPASDGRRISHKLSGSVNETIAFYTIEIRFYSLSSR